jgi:hypothetical protein
MTWMVFKAPGPHEIHGHQVQYKVIDEAQREQYLADGWHDTAIAAGESKLAADRAVEEQKEAEADDKAAVTREEAEQQLEKLGIAFDRRLGTKKLLKLVEDTLAARAGAQG